MATTSAACWTRRPAPGAAPCFDKLRLDGVAPADQDDVDVGVLAPEIERGRHRHMGAVIAPHAIDWRR